MRVMAAACIGLLDVTDSKFRGHKRDRKSARLRSVRMYDIFVIFLCAGRFHSSPMILLRRSAFDVPLVAVYITVVLSTFTSISSMLSRSKCSRAKQSAMASFSLMWRRRSHLFQRFAETAVNPSARNKTAPMPLSLASVKRIARRISCGRGDHCTLMGVPLSPSVSSSHSIMVGRTHFQVFAGSSNGEDCAARRLKNL